MLNNIATQTGTALTHKWWRGHARHVRFKKADLKKERSVLVFFDELHGFCDDGFGQFLVLEACRMTALHVADAADAVNDRAGMLLIRTIPVEKFGVLQTGWLITDVGQVADGDGVGRVKILHLMIFNPNAWYAIHGGGNDVAIVKADLERARFDFPVEIHIGLTVTEAEMPFTDNAGLVTGLAKHGRKSKPAWFNAERCITIEDRVLLGGLAPGVFAG